MMHITKVITIDGPVASGKSSVARALAKTLNFYYLYTGLLYRAVAYVKYIVLQDADAAQLLDFIPNIVYEYVNGVPHIYYCEKDITTFLYDSMLDQKASIVSADKNVRNALLNVQRSIAKKYNIIADGRDCGTVVFPQADIKFFLTADLEIRARRLMADAKRNAMALSYEQAVFEVQQRDNRDASREIAPLRISDGAIVIDNTYMTFDETLHQFLRIVDDKFSL